MEGVGARMGRSSTRYGPATVFTGPVRKWKKKWVHVTPSPNVLTSNHSSSVKGTNANGNGAHLLLYKWTPLSQSQNQNNNNNNNNGDDSSLNNEPPRRKFKYVPIAVLEEQNDEDEDEEQAEVEDEPKSSETNAEAVASNAKADGSDKKPDINDVPMEENEDTDNPVGRKDLNESTLDLCLGLNSNEDDNDYDPRKVQTKDG